MSNEGRAFGVSGITFNDESFLFGGNFDPSVSGYQAPIGAHFFRDTGQQYTKDGALDTDWVLAGATGGSPAHNDTTGKQGGVPGEYYHLSATELSDLLAHLTNTSNPHSTPIANLVDTLISGGADDQALVLEGGVWKNKEIAVPPAGSGKLVQVKFGTIPGMSGTTTMPDEDTAPSNTDGTQVWTETITPTEADSKIRIGSSMVASGSNSNTKIRIVVYRDGVPIGESHHDVTGTNSGSGISFTFYDEPNTTSAIVYTCRVGKSNGGTWYINQFPGVTLAENPWVQQNAYTVEEIGTT